MVYKSPYSDVRNNARQEETRDTNFQETNMMVTEIWNKNEQR